MRSLSPKTLKKIKLPKRNEVGSESGNAILPFVPNPGGQQQFLDLVPLNEPPKDEEIRWYYLRGGVGSGKSRAGSAFVVSRTALFPGVRGLITAQSFPQLMDSTLVALAEYCRDYGHKIEPCGSTVNETARKIAFKRTCRINETDILVKSMESFTGISAKSKESSRGIEAGWAWVDEGSYGDKTGFDTLNTRLRWTSEGYHCHGVITSSINKNNPYNFCFDYFDDPDRSEDLKRIHRTIPLTTSENVKHLGEDYERSLRASLTPELIKIELEGEYQSVSTGKIFPYFDRAKHLAEIVIAPQEITYVSFDFNWSPAVAIIAQERNVNGVRSLYLHKEFYLKNANTFVSSDAVCNYLKSIDATNVHVFGDASGNQKTANSNQSNWQIVWDAFRRYGLNAQGRYPKSNPSVIDTINACNALFNQDRFYVNPRCRESIKDLEFLTFKEGSDPPAIDKSNLDRSHLCDTIRYLAFGLFPITAPPRPKTGTWSF